MNPMEIEDLEILAFLYRNIGLKWELDIKQHSELYSYTIRQDLDTFIHTNGLLLKEKKTVDIPDQVERINSFFYTSNKNLIYGLFNHLRNAIMHGSYILEYNNDQIVFHCTDMSPTNHQISMRGKIEYSLLVRLITSINQN